MAVPHRALEVLLDVVRWGARPITKGGMDYVDQQVALIYQALEKNAEE